LSSSREGGDSVFTSPPLHQDVFTVPPLQKDGLLALPWRRIDYLSSSRERVLIILPIEKGGGVLITLPIEKTSLIHMVVGGICGGSGTGGGILHLPSHSSIV
jgi:hypothetical protein